jgi:hypothetical protein
MIAVLGGALTLVILELVISSPATAGRLGDLGSTISHVVARFVDPTVPMIGSTAPAASTSSASSGPTPAAPVGPTSSPTPPASTPAGPTYAAESAAY